MSASPSNNNHLNKPSRSGLTGSSSMEIPAAFRGRDDGWIPHSADISATPGGTLYATTPGGTKIVYDRSTMMKLANSPLSRSPLDLPKIPGLTDGPSRSTTKASELKQAGDAPPTQAVAVGDDDPLFTME